MKASKNLKHGINATALTIIVIAGVVIVNLILSTLNGKFPLDIDLTRDKIYEISQQTKDTMKALDKDVTAYVMAREGESGGVTDDYLDRYRQLSSHFKVEYVDPQTNPTFVKNMRKAEIPFPREILSLNAATIIILSLPTKCIPAPRTLRILT